MSENVKTLLKGVGVDFVSRTPVNKKIVSETRQVPPKKLSDKELFEKEFMKYLKEQGYKIDDSISEDVIGFGEILPKGEYVLVNDILNKEEEELSAKKGDKLEVFEDEPPIDTILGVEIFPVVHLKTKEVIYVSLEDIK